METAFLMQKKQSEDKNNVNRQLQKISGKVLEICCFGKENKGKPRELANALVRLITRVIDEHVKNHKESKEGEFRPSMMTTDKGICGISLDSWNKYFCKDPSKPGAYFINPSVLPIILNFMHQAEITAENPHELPFYNDLQELKKIEQSDFLPFIAFLTYKWVLNVQSPTARNKGKEKAAMMNVIYTMESKEEPKNKEHRKLVIQGIINDLKFGSFYFGVGNCQAMAELAFLLAIQNLNMTPIRYIQFQDSKGKYDELNAIVVGPWPTIDCMVLAPWYSEEPFEWKGSLEKTPEITAYDTATILFTIKNRQEQKMYQELLTEENFNVEELLVHANRNKYSDFISKTSEKVYNEIHEVITPKQKIFK